MPDEFTYIKETVFQGAPHTGLPSMIVRGSDQKLGVAWMLQETRVSPTAGTFTLKQGSKVIIDNVPCTTLGTAVTPTSATYDILGADTLSESLGSDYLEIWTLTPNPATAHGLGPPVEFRRSASLVLSALWPMVNDSDLVARHSRLDDLLPPAETNWARYRELAWEILNRDLIKKGRRPELVLDSYALIDAHVYKSLELIFRDLSTLVGDGRYTEFAILYGEAYTAEWEVIQFRYDRNEDNAISPGELESGSPSLWLGVPPGFPSSVVKGG
jgi:hypothetical protein